MKITRENYEAFFIDYLEGNLDKRLMDNFIEFLQQNPDLKDELLLFEDIVARPETVLFRKKKNLYKEKLDSDKEFNKVAIAKLEGDISESEKAELESYLLSHPEKQKELTLFKKTKLYADESIVFTKKQKLYRRSVGRTVFLWFGRVAAVLIISFAVFSLIDNRSGIKIPENQIAKVDEKPTKKNTQSEEKKNLVEPQKIEVEKKKKASPKLNVKKVVPQKNINKKPPENSEERVKHEDLPVRIPIEVPAKMNRLTASIDVVVPKASFVKPDVIIPDNQDDYYNERLITDVVKEKIGLDKLRLHDIQRTTLQLIQSITKDKFQYKINEEGKITNYKYDSRLLAFTIITKNSVKVDEVRSETSDDYE